MTKATKNNRDETFAYDTTCHEEESQQNIFLSPTAKTSNDLLWNDYGDYGLLVRTPDYIHLLDTKKEHIYTPASFLHASIRANNVIYPGSSNKPIVSHLIGTKYRRNKSMRNKYPNGNDDDEYVECVSYYPTDSFTYRRGALTNIHGTGCTGFAHEVCINGTCTTRGKSDNCVCDYKIVPGKSFGEYIAHYYQNDTNKKNKFREKIAFGVCSYPNTDRGVREMVDASNSLWKERHRWYYNPSQPSSFVESRYEGWNECTATMNIIDKRMMDAIVVKLPPTTSLYTDASLCTSAATRNTQQLGVIQRALQDMYKSGYGSLPVIIMRETKGMNNQTECDRVWGGMDCEDGYRKEFFSQSFRFRNGACLSMPDGCEEVYYFPADKQREGSCRPSAKVCGGVAMEEDAFMASRGDDLMMMLSSSSSIVAFLGVLLSSLVIGMVVLRKTRVSYVRKHLFNKQNDE